MTLPLSPRLRPYAIAAIVLLLLGAGYLFYQQNTHSTYPEVEYLNGVSFDFTQYSKYLTELAEDKGAVYSYEVMKRAHFPEGISLHLIAHSVGDVLYKQKGVSGMTDCTQDFRNACSHSIVTGVLAEEGPGSLPKIADVCRTAPGAGAAYGMCFHGLGHGVLAYNLYDFQKTVAMCERAGGGASGTEYTECIGGATMELVSGVHDRAAWAVESKRYFSQADPLAPCTASFMPAAARPMCLIYLTPHLMSMAGVDLSRIDPVFFPKALSYCATLPSGSRDRDACYSGFGKEFPAMSSATYVIDLGTLGATEVGKIHAWCAGAGTEDGVLSCNRGALSSLIWGGENSPEASLAFCTLMQGQIQKQCYADLANYIRINRKAAPSLVSACSRLPQEYQETCTG